MIGFLYKRYLFTTTATAAVFLLRGVLRRTVSTSELRYGERDASEESTGIIVVCSLSAFLIGHAIVGSVNKKLCGTDYSYYREDSEGNVDLRSCGISDETIAEYVSHTLGNIRIFAAGTGAGASAFGHLRAENNGLNGFNDCGGSVGCCRIQVTNAAIRAGGA